MNCTPAGMLDQHRARRRPRARGVRAPLALVLALMGLHLSVGAAWADELIVDDADAAVQLTGTWEASATTPGFYGGGYLFHAPGHGSASVRWPFPADGAPGRYQVFVRWTSGPNRPAQPFTRSWIAPARCRCTSINRSVASGGTPSGHLPSSRAPAKA